MPAPQLLYLHGFASGPGSTKGTAVARHWEARGLAVARLNLRVPSFERLRFSEMMRVTGEAIGEPRDRAVLFGSSLGGLCATRVAERDPRVCGLVLLAPAFRLLERWRARLGADGWKASQDTGFLEVFDHAEKQPGRVDWGFVTDLERADAVGDGWPDVRVPTLAIHGRDDDVVDIDNTRRWAADRPHVRLVEVDDGHELAKSLPTILAESDVFLSPYFPS